jgi:hypothetical protein
MKGQTKGVKVVSLFHLLEFFGIEQREVQEALGVTKTATSLWANGKRPMPDKHVPAFIEFLDQVMDKRYASAKGYPNAQKIIIERIKQAGDAWFGENAEAQGLWALVADKELRKLAAYADLGPEKLLVALREDQEMRQRILESTQALQQVVLITAQMRPLPPLTLALARENSPEGSR